MLADEETGRRLRAGAAAIRAAGDRPAPPSLAVDVVDTTEAETPEAAVARAREVLAAR
jgi:hypothetical protein